MSRFSNPVPQFFDLNGDPYPGGKIYFFEPGTTTPKNTFSDAGLSIANPNPVVLDGNGRMPSTFLDGTYKCVLKDADGETVWTRDPIGETTAGAFQAWLNDETYNVPDIVLGSDDEYYRSLTNNNQGNDPTFSSENWEQLQIGRVWNSNITYDSGDSVYYTDGKLYLSLQGANTNNIPPDSNGFWRIMGYDNQVLTVGASVASNALTVTLDPCVLDFRSSTLTNGDVSTESITSELSLTVSSGSTLGTTDGNPARLLILALYNGGTPALGIVNEKCGLNLDESGVVTTVAEGGAGGADSATTIYSASAIVDTPYRIVGWIGSTQPVAGTWDTAPTKIQGAGGDSLSGIDTRVFQDVSGSRTSGVEYLNDSGRTRWVSIFLQSSSGGGAAGVDSYVTVDGRRLAQAADISGTSGHQATFPVFPNSVYELTVLFNNAGVPNSGSTWEEA